MKSLVLENLLRSFDPEQFCQTDPKTKKFYDKLQEVLLKPVSV